MEFQQILIASFLTAVVIIGLVTGGSIFASENGSTEDAIKDDRLNFTSLENKVNEMNEESQSWERSIKSDNIFVGTVLVLLSLWGVMKLMWGFVIEIVEITLGSVASLLGIPPVYIAAAVTMLIILLIFAAWRALKS